MNNDIDYIIDLFDEFILVPEKEETASTLSKTVHVEQTVEPVVETVLAEPAVNLPASNHHAQEPELQTPAPIIPLNYSGANKRHIVFIYNDKVNDSRENVEMLSNLITKALKFSMDDVAVVRVSKNQNHNFKSVNEVLKPAHLLLFGASEWLDDPQFGIHDVVKIDGVKVLIADAIDAYHGRQEYKGALWNGIQQLFNS